MTNLQSANSYGRLGFFALFLAVVLCFSFPARAQQGTNVYFAGFEKAEGFDTAYELVGQQGWQGYPSVSGGNGLIADFLGSQAAYVGLFALTPATNYLNLWHPINYTPPANAGMLEFSVRLLVANSTTNQWDNFHWVLYNSRIERLVTLDFDNYDLGVYYNLDGTNEFQFTGTTFTNEVPYLLKMTFDFQQNRWSATLDGDALVTNQPITTTHALLDVGDIDAVWAVYDAKKPGDNFMVFDDYRLRLVRSPGVQPSIALLGKPANGQVLLRVSANDGARVAVEVGANLVNWISLKTNLVTDGYSDFVDTTANSSESARFYRARLVP